MGARVTIDHPGRGVLRIELRQDAGEAIRFAAFVVIVAGALYALTPAVRAAPGWLVALTFLAATWAAIALTAREEYTIDTLAESIVATRVSAIGSRQQSIGTQEVAAVRITIGGPDDNRRLVELLGSDGAPRLRLPGRMTTLSEADQTAVGEAIAEHLGVRCRGLANQ